jgi:hypothetical protein
MPAQSLSIRPTSPADLQAVTALLSQRDAAALEHGHVANALEGLEPANIAGWIALADGTPAGLTTLYVRDQRWGDKTIRAGYWAHLFVPEQYRRLMVYPQLVLAMMRGIKPLGIDAIFTGTRRPHVAEGHVKLGFAKLGELRVAFKPLRPFRLVTRHKKWPGLLQALAPIGDIPFGWTLRSVPAPAGIGFELIHAKAAPHDQLAAVLNAAQPQRSVRQAWNAQGLARRLAGTIDGEQYRVLLARRGENVVAFSILRTARREGVTAGVIMEAAATPDAEHLLPPLLRASEFRLRRLGADTTLALTRPRHDEPGLTRADGHRLSKDTYSMLVWPRTLVPKDAPASDLDNWRFSLLDHDAF